MLYQDHDGTEKVIAYTSRGLRNREKLYLAHKLEFLCLKWAVTDKFHDYLYGNTFTVCSDNNPLTSVLSSAKLDATDHSCLAFFGSYYTRKRLDFAYKHPNFVIALLDKNVLVYTAQRASVGSTAKTLHRNMLLPFSVIPGIAEVSIEPALFKSRN